MTPSQLAFIRACTDYLNLPDVNSLECNLILDNQEYTLYGENFRACLRGGLKDNNFVVDVYHEDQSARIKGDLMFRSFMNEMVYSYMLGPGPMCPHFHNELRCPICKSTKKLGEEDDQKKEI